MTATDDRIAELFEGGYGLDYISERGVHGGWSRMDALRVASERGWELDKSGRIPREARPAPRPPAALRPGRVMDDKPPRRPDSPVRPAPTPPAAPTPPPTAQPTSRPEGTPVDNVKDKIAAALRSEHAPIRTAATKANDALAKLDTLLADWDAKELARQRVAKLEQELAAAKAALRGGQQTKKPTAAGEHKLAREWARANGIEVTAIGRVAQDVLDRYRQATGNAA